MAQSHIVIDQSSHQQQLGSRGSIETTLAHIWYSNYMVRCRGSPTERLHLSEYTCYSSALEILSIGLK